MTGPSREATRQPTAVSGGPSLTPRWNARALPDPAWAALLALLAVWVTIRIGVFDLWGSVPIDGVAVHLPDAFAGVDHPFHATRAETLRRALVDGEVLRWVGHHQGGYPVELYPLGVAWIEVGLWALLLGTLPIVAVHKLVVGLIFLLPGLAFLRLARHDGWSLGVALAAFAAHVAVPGGWEHGGYTELVQWGLVTNVAASVALLFVLLWLTAYLDGGRGGAAAGAALAAAFAISTNPRSLIALGVVGLGATLSQSARARDGALDPSILLRRLALVVGVTALIAAPELVALVRFADLYDFVRYESYAGAGDYLRNAIQAVSPPVFVLGVVGMVLAPALPGRAMTRAAAATMPLYAGVTLLLAQPRAASFVPQLEATRLMPFQRLLTIYLAAVALHQLLGWLTDRLGGPRTFLADALQCTAALALLVAFVTPAGATPPEPAAPPVPPHGLYPVVGTASATQADLRAAIEAADDAAAPGTALLVLGSALSWHQQLWAPLWTDRPLFYDDWLWYWQPRHAGPPGYVFRNGHHYPYPELALDPNYLARHGVGAVAVTGRPGPDAAVAPALTRVRSGIYDVYAVREPTTIVTIAGANAAVSEIGNQRLLATGWSADGDATIRRNWYPRWRATVNGRPASITRTGDGYMSVPVPPGEVRIELVYAVDAIDWFARILSVVGLLLSGWLSLGRRLRTPRSTASPPI